MSRRDRGVELAAVRLTEEFIVFGKVNHVGVDAYIDPSVQKRKRRNRRGEHCSPVPTPPPQLLRPSGTSSMRGGDLAPLIEELAAVRLTEEFAL